MNGLSKRPWLATIKTHVFRGVKFALVWKRPTYPRPPNGKVWEGEVDHEKKRMMVNAYCSDEELFWNMFHESIHTCFPDLDDHSVDQWEADQKRLAKRTGLHVSFSNPNPLRPTPIL